MKCSIQRCRDEAEIVVLGQPLCEKHWLEHGKEEKQ